jgi:hypothetical protein
MDLRLSAFRMSQQADGEGAKERRSADGEIHQQKCPVQMAPFVEAGSTIIGPRACQAARENSGAWNLGVIDPGAQARGSLWAKDRLWMNPVLSRLQSCKESC